MSARGIQQQGLLSGALTPASSIQALERRPQPSPGVPRAADPPSLSLLCTPGRRSVLGGCPLRPVGPRRRLSPSRPGLAITLRWVGGCVCAFWHCIRPRALTGHSTNGCPFSGCCLLALSPAWALSLGLSALRSTQSTPARSLCLKSGLEGERCPLSAHVEIAWEASKLLALKAVGCPEFSSPLEGFWGVGRLAADPSSSDDVNSLLRPAGM
ncbi:uncharacterized protein LOC131484317 [Neofelis nebulosa]|uniref:uncharacterized protein LOC131484317 n=1 Tax=Neofelis nebulosa TaxID=61452 RepID=UPI00272DA57A|nr:uncharacterized protein LOC131484317 [Neofelis nebulosa]